MRTVRVAFLGCLVLLHAGRAWSADVPARKPRIVKARIKNGKWREFSTRTLAHLAGFRPAGPVRTSKYGGWLGHRLEATGFFRVAKSKGRWWLVDPDGCLFLHVGVVSVSSRLSPKGRRVFPTTFGSLETWRDRTVALLREHGFNGTGNWSSDELLAGATDRLAYCPGLNFMGSYGRKRGGVFQKPGHLGYPSSCIFVFDPGFEAFAGQYARQVARLKDDPYVVGYFSDNELPFPRDSLDRYLKLDPKDPGRRAAEAWLAKRKGRAGRKPRINDVDREAWRGHVADRYLSIVGRAIRKYDPNHLYLGPRFHGSEKRSEAVFRAAGKHLDAIAINVYGVWTPDKPAFERWTRWSGRPVLVTEWYAKGDDSGMANMTGAGWTVATQAERGHFYQNFTLGLLATRCCVGWHWFKYRDNDPEDTRTDPSNRNSNKGIVTATFEPYRPLLDAMKELNAVVYPLTDYFDAKP